MNDYHETINALNRFYDYLSTDMPCPAPFLKSLDNAITLLKHYRAGLEESKQAIDFFEKVQQATEPERIAVGTDAFDWLLSAARNARKILEGTKDE